MQIYQKELCDKIKLIIKNFVYLEENLQKPDQRNYMFQIKK